MHIIIKNFLTQHSAVLLTAAALSACGQPASEAPAASSTEAPAQAAAIAAGVPAEALTAPPPTGVNGAEVDVCALLDPADAMAAAGTLYKPAEARPAQGSLLGQCEYFGNKLMLMLSARPAAEYNGTLSFAAEKGGSQSVGGLGSKADMTPMGLMIQPAGKPYFILVYTMAGGKFKEAAALEIGRKLKL